MRPHMATSLRFLTRAFAVSSAGWQPILLAAALAGCAPHNYVPSGAPRSTAWQPPAGAQPVPLSTMPVRYDFSGIRTAINGRQTDPDTALDTLSRQFSYELGQITPQGDPIAPSAMIVLPDHARLRVLAMATMHQAGGGAVEFNAEQRRLELHLVADAVARSGVFGRVSIVEQNDTTAPDAAGADVLLWYQVRSLTPANVGPWISRWQMKRAERPVPDLVGMDPGTPAGPPRLLSFVNSIRVAAGNRSAMPAAAFAGAALPAHPPVARPISSGSGIVVDEAGHVLTNNHVIAACPSPRVIGSDGRSINAERVAADPADDLALLGTGRHWPAWARLRDSRTLRPGESVVVTGFPLEGFVSPEMAVTTGSVTVLGGARGDARQFEFSAPVQPGNSGGPVLDDSGRVIGVATSVLNGLALAALSGTMPQNVNFAIKSDVVADFLASNHIAANASAEGRTMSAAEIGDLARPFTVKIECWR